MGVMEKNVVNIAVHGQPVLRCTVHSEGNEGEARAAGADGTSGGYRCTGTRFDEADPSPDPRVPELPILTGALDAMVVDYQCLSFPGGSSPPLRHLGDHYHGHGQIQVPRISNWLKERPKKSQSGIQL